MERAGNRGVKHWSGPCCSSYPSHYEEQWEDTLDITLHRANDETHSVMYIYIYFLCNTCYWLHMPHMLFCFFLFRFVHKLYPVACLIIDMIEEQMSFLHCMGLEIVQQTFHVVWHLKKLLFWSYANGVCAMVISKRGSFSLFDLSGL